MDFLQDVNAQNIGDQFMHGPAILVNPVAEPGANSRPLYLPSAKWYDFWTGTSAQGGNIVDVPAPIERMPLYVRAGSIIPLGPEEEYSTLADPIEPRIYPGADGDLTLYEDENDTYNYEKGQYATIPIHWNDASRVLTIGERKGLFPGMLANRIFNIVFVGPDDGTGGESLRNPDRTVQYSGREVSVSGGDQVAVR